MVHLEEQYGNMHISPDLIFSFLIHAARLKLTLAHQHGLSLRELLVIGIVATQGPVSFKQLHQLLAIPKSALTGLIDNLTDRRLVNRRQDSEDRRRWFVALTNSGRRLVQDIQEEDTRLIQGALESLEESEQAAFVKAADAVYRELAAANPRASTAARYRAEHTSDRPTDGLSRQRLSLTAEKQ